MKNRPTSEQTGISRMGKRCNYRSRRYRASLDSGDSACALTPVDMASRQERLVKEPLVGQSLVDALTLLCQNYCSFGPGRPGLFSGAYRLSAAVLHDRKRTISKQVAGLDKAKANSSLKSNRDIDQQVCPPDIDLRRETMDRKIDIDDDQFHDSATEDLYDLYNACNGVMHEGLLDVRKLDELSAEEIEVLDIDRLREVWHHMASGSGCDRCKAIVNTLNSVREQRRKQAI